MGQMQLGKVSHIQMWDYEMTADQVKALTCNDVGSVINPDSLQIAGGANHYEEITLGQKTGIVGKTSSVSQSSYLHCLVMMLNEWDFICCCMGAYH